MSRRADLALWLGSASVLLAGLASAVRADQQSADFAQVQAVFKAKCVTCHGESAASGGLRLDTFEATMKGGLSGRVIVPGDAKRSLLVNRIHGEGGLPRMPMGFAPLTDKEVSIIETWIAAGAKQGEANQRHWAYKMPVRPDVPKVARAAWVRNPIDAFVLARLEHEGLEPSPEADRTTLIRRLTLDLTGLPPSIEEVEAFLSDKSKDAYEIVVDRLLASPHYGERMALPWLDAARYADSNGFQQDADNYQFVWRDWVVKALNDNMPFDEFLTQQLAGDLLPGANEETHEGRALLVATGFNRNHMINNEGGAIPEEQRNVAVFDRVDTTSTVFLGLTMACARCHDHKYDPVTQRDYYSMMAFFNNVPEMGIPDGGSPYNVAKPWIYAGTKEQMDEREAIRKKMTPLGQELQRIRALPESKAALEDWKKMRDPNMPKEILDLLAKEKRNTFEESKVSNHFFDVVITGQYATVRDEYERLRAEAIELSSAIPKAMVMSEANPRKTYIYNRGNYTERLEEVTPYTPSNLPRFGAHRPRNRLGLAMWLTDPSNPLVARVQVNRSWQVFFGAGLVRTPEDFGVQGERPTHPDLLDWLAVEYATNGWDTKRLHKLIVTSATYRQSSKLSSRLLHKDPENKLLARGARFRMPAMLLRDVALAASGLINRKLGGKPVYPYQPTGIWDGLAITRERDFTYPQSKGEDLYRRSIYSFWRRTAAPGNIFDAASRQVCTVREYRTSTPLHALTTMNDVTWVEAGRALAQRAMHDKQSTRDRLVHAFQLVCARKPDKEELAILERSLAKATVHYRQDTAAAALYLQQGDSKRDESLDPVEHAALANVCLAILNLDEALTRE